MAAALATLHWHRFSERVLDKPIQTGYASVASFCFDGNVIEAAVYWLEPSLQPKKRVYDVHSMRIAAGHAFATSLDEFVAVRRKFRNVFDWLQKAREDRYKAILELPEDAPADRRKVMLPIELNAVASPVQPEGDKPQAITVNLPDRAQPRSQGAGEEDEEEEDEEEAMLADSSTGLSQQAGGLGLDGADGRTGPGARAGPSGGDTASRTTKSSGKRRGPSNASKDQRSKRGRP